MGGQTVLPVDELTRQVGSSAAASILENERKLVVDQHLQVGVEAVGDDHVFVRVVDEADHLAFGTFARRVEVDEQRGGTAVVHAVREAQPFAQNDIGIDAFVDHVRVFQEQVVVDVGNAFVVGGAVFEDLFDRAQVVRVLGDVGAQDEYRNFPFFVLLPVRAVHLGQQVQEAVRAVRVDFFERIQLGRRGAGGEREFVKAGGGQGGFEA